MNSQGMRRILILGGIFGIATFLILFAKLWQLQVVQHETLSEKAVTQQTREISTTANRGTIYDSNGAILAISGPVQNVILSPRDVLEFAEVDTTDEFGNPRSQKAIESEQKQKLQSTYDLIADGMSEILHVDRDDIIRRLNKTNSAWEKLAEKIEDDVADQVRAFIDKNDLESCLFLTDASKRYYPYSTLASQVIGFVNKQNQGAYGLEALYNDELAGKDGRIIIEKNASGTEMPSSYSNYTDALNGYDVHTTIDATIQMYAEKTLAEGIEKFRVTNGAFCIVMQPKTGAILAMASNPEYDLNDPNAINDPEIAAKLKSMKNNPRVSEEEYAEALGAAQFAQWNSKLLNTSYEPGSTFKPLVVAAGLEEGVVTEDSMFYCSGKVHVGDWDIRCSSRSGHGSQNLRKALMNSCNPALIDVGQKLGAEKFYEYWENFGFTEKTGIELPGEFDSYFWKKEDFISPGGITSLATASFGQRFQVTPLQLVTALSATINGGHLMEPYLVQSVTDEDGNVISYHEPNEVRQVISQETSDLVRSFMESVVGDTGGTGKNARVEGYRIGGKTGSSQTLDSKDHIIVSFVGFAPADDPEIIVLLGYDWPQPGASGANTTADGVYISGGSMAAPMAGELIANILDYKGYSKSGETTTTSSGVIIPRLTGNTMEEAQKALAGLGLNYRTSGEGTTVTDQAPSPGSSVPPGSSIVLYLGTPKDDGTVAMPDLSGLTYDAAKTMLENLGLYLNATGTTEGGTVFSQEVPAGTPLESGTAVEVKFSDNAVQDDEFVPPE